MKWLCGACLFALLVLCGWPARAQEQAPARLAIEAAPLLGDVTLTPSSWGEVLVRIANHGREPESGTIAVAVTSAYDRDRSLRTRAPFTVAPGATVTQRLPLYMTDLGDPTVTVRSDGGRLLHEQTFGRAVDNRVLLALVSRNQALGTVLRGLPIVTPADPWAPGAYSRSNPGMVEVTSPPYDPATGDAILPLRAASYGRIAAALVHSDELGRMGAAELDALATWVMGGGTLALVVARPEDLRHERLTRLCGGAVHATAVSPLTLAPIALPSPPAAGGGMLGLGGTRPMPSATEPSASVAPRLSGWEGGNLRATPYGASASYGLGEVHLLAFDPTEPPAVEDPWVQLRIADVLRRATERQTVLILRLGEAGGDVREIRKQLDPNESSRWAIVIASLLLLLHAVLAGPVNFSHWRQKGKPLRALSTLAAISAGTFTLIVLTGTFAKGCTGRARQLTFVEAGAGMPIGVARRWRGYFVPSSREITVAASSVSSVLADAREGDSDEPAEELRIDRDGPREDLGLRPWQTRVVREEGTASLGDGIALVRKSDDETVVVNRTGRSLRALVLWQPGDGARYHERLDDGERVSSRDCRSLSAASYTNSSWPGMTTNDFQSYAISTVLDAASPGLAEAWDAVQRSRDGVRNWFPNDVPVLLAQVDGAEGRTHDGGLRIEKARMLVRVVGWGGAH